jgi:uncharacterized protein YutE (UPF0331/DUF86 family)
MTIVAIDSEYGDYTMKEDNGDYSWDAEMFEGVVDADQLNVYGELDSPMVDDFIQDDSELDNIDKYIMRFDGNECKIALPEGYQFVDREGNIIDTSVIMVTKKEVEYPKDYDGCCNVLNDDDKMSLWMMNELRKLVNARNAYWKIYGEANGLGGSWKPDWEAGCYVIFTKGDGTIERDLQFGINAILAFPTKELCDMFYERFISEIEQCKELL